MTAAELRAHLERLASDAAEMNATAPVAQVLRLVLTQLQAFQGTEPSSEASRPDEHLLSAEEVAKRLGVSRRYVYEHAARFPFTRRLGPRTVRFSQQGLERWLSRQ